MELDPRPGLGSAQSALLRALVGSAACVSVVRADDGRLIWANDAFLSLVGYEHDDVIGKTLEEAGLSVLSSSARIRDAQSREEGARLRFQVRTRSGKTRYLEGERTRNDTLVVTIAHDITDHELVRDELEASRTFALAISDAVPVGFVAMDAGFRISYANTLAAELMSTTRTGLLGKLFWDEFPSAKYPPLSVAAHGVLEDGVSRRVEQFCPPFETWFEVNVVPLQGGLAVYFADIGERKRAEGEAARLAALVDSTDDAIFTKTLDEVITSWNPAAERLYGYTAQEAIGRSVPDLLVPPGEHDDTREITSKALSGERVVAHEARRRRKDGTVVDMALTVSPIYDSSGDATGLAVIGRDVDLANRRIRDAAFLAAIVNTSGDAITSVSPEGMFTSWNPAAERIFGYTAQEALGHTPGELLIPEGTLKDSEVFLRQVTERETPIGLEVPLRTKDGTLVDIAMTISPLSDAEGNVIGSSAVGRDVTRERQAENHLLEEKTRYRSLVEQVPAVIYNWGVAGDIHHVTENYVSPQIEAMLGYSVEEWLADPTMWFTRTHPDDRDRVVAESMRAIEEAVPFRMEYRMLAKDGREVWVRDEALVQERDANGKGSLFRGVQVDITAQIRVEEAIQRAREEKARFVQLLAHELFTPITAIQGAAMTLSALGPGLEATDLAALADGVVRGTERLRRLVHNLDVAARLDREGDVFTPRTIPIGELLGEALSVGGFDLDPACIALSVDELAAARSTTTDLHLATEALRVVVENALDFAADQPVEVELREGEGALLIFVRDRGPGVPEGERDQIFEPFTQVDTSDTRTHQGLGLGLFLARRVMRLNGGDLTYEDRSGGGSVFTFRFPQVEPAD